MVLSIAGEQRAPRWTGGSPPTDQNHARAGRRSRWPERPAPQRPGRDLGDRGAPRGRL